MTDDQQDIRRRAFEAAMEINREGHGDLDFVLADARRIAAYLSGDDVQPESVVEPKQDDVWLFRASVKNGVETTVGEVPPPEPMADPVQTPAETKAEPAPEPQAEPVPRKARKAKGRKPKKARPARTGANGHAGEVFGEGAGETAPVPLHAESAAEPMPVAA